MCGVIKTLLVDHTEAVLSINVHKSPVCLVTVLSFMAHKCRLQRALTLLSSRRTSGAHRTYYIGAQRRNVLIMATYGITNERVVIIDQCIDPDNDIHEVCGWAILALLVRTSSKEKAPARCVRFLSVRGITVDGRPSPFPLCLREPPTGRIFREEQNKKNLELTTRKQRAWNASITAQHHYHICFDKPSFERGAIPVVSSRWVLVRRIVCAKGCPQKESRQHGGGTSFSAGFMGVWSVYDTPRIAPTLL